MSRDTPKALDDLDRAIIAQLRSDGRKGNRELARILSISEANVRNRLRRLQGEGVLQIIAVVEPAKVELPIDTFFMMRVAPARLAEVTRLLTDNPHVRYVAQTTGHYNILSAALFRDVAEYTHFVMNDIAGLEGVHSVEPMFITDISKRTYDWTSNLAPGVANNAKKATRRQETGRKRGTDR